MATNSAAEHQAQGSSIDNAPTAVADPRIHAEHPVQESTNTVPADDPSTQRHRSDATSGPSSSGTAHLEKAATAAGTRNTSQTVQGASLPANVEINVMASQQGMGPSFHTSEVVLGTSLGSSISHVTDQSQVAMPIPVVNVLHNTPPQPALAEASTRNSTTSGSSSSASPGFISMPAPQAFQPIYSSYPLPQPLYTTIEPPRAIPPFTSTPPPSIQYIHMAPPSSRTGSPLSFVQLINGQPMLVQPLTHQLEGQHVGQNPPSPVVVLQHTHIPEPQPQPQNVTTPQVEARHSSIPTTIPNPNLNSSSTSPTREEVPPAVPPKSSTTSSSTQLQGYLPSRVTNSSMNMTTPIRSLEEVSCDVDPRPTTTSTTNNNLTTLPPHIQTHIQKQTRAQQKRLSWDETVSNPPSSSAATGTSNGRRVVSGYGSSSGHHHNHHQATSTATGGQVYSNVHLDVHPNSHNPHPNPNPNPNSHLNSQYTQYTYPGPTLSTTTTTNPYERERDIQRPQRAYSASGFGFGSGLGRVDNSGSGSGRADGWRTGQGQGQGQGQGIINLDDLERGDHNHNHATHGAGASRRGSVYSMGVSSRYDLNPNGRVVSGRRRSGGVDLSQIPVVMGGGGGGSEEGASDQTRISGSGNANARRGNGGGGGGGDDDGGGGGGRGGDGGIWRMLGLGWGRGRGRDRDRPPTQRKASDFVDELSTVSREKSIAERLAPTLEHAQEELRKAKVQAKATGWSLNVAIGAQVVLGALTTGVAAATTGKQTSIATSILGGLSTLAASYLAKARGSGEPEASSLRCKDLENFVRDLENLRLDRGHLCGESWDGVVRSFRERFEEIMGNGSGASIGGGSGGSGGGGGGGGGGAVKIAGEIVRDRVKEEFVGRVAPRLGMQGCEMPGSWKEVEELAYRRAEELEKERVRRVGGVGREKEKEMGGGSGERENEKEHAKENEKEKEKAKREESSKVEDHDGQPQPPKRQS